MARERTETLEKILKSIGDALMRAKVIRLDTEKERIEREIGALGTEMNRKSAKPSSRS
jgi:hypothetical protein